MKFQGRRFSINLSDNEDEENRSPMSLSQPILIQDIKERPIAGQASAPTFTPNTSGFPAHKKRHGASAFRQKRDLNMKKTSSEQSNKMNCSSIVDESTFNITERQHIDKENQQRLSEMTSKEIEDERQEIFSQLDPSLIEKLLKRANLDEARGDTGVEQIVKPDVNKKQEDRTETVQINSQSTEFVEGVPAPKVNGEQINTRSVRFMEDEEQPVSTIGLQPVSAEPIPLFDKQDLHFPKGPPVPDLDPSDPSFLENLHAKYFPNLPVDPSKLSWMAPIPTYGSIADQNSSYYPAQSSLPASALRFSFRGGILPPRIARAVPVTKGLHHHGEAPEAAGYTIPELSHLARSVYPAQRCIAFQTLGRLLYRLGRGEWGGKDSDISQGLWRCVEEGQVISTLENAASVEGGHQGSKAYAVEALWLWQKGGGKSGDLRT